MFVILLLKIQAGFKRDMLKSNDTRQSDMTDFVLRHLEPKMEMARKVPQSKAKQNLRLSHFIICHVSE